ncbi:hypothetical protein WR25_26925 [Diploscapter pachys]|uniref:Uncharacterized protein n=1 Tax=Diploscapter pachys TaxID=2018661 RepID=A0A2A2JUU6_9BILA|nr:hypothetical protein WR25_26925 [Diploscapter pachys]
MANLSESLQSVPGKAMEFMSSLMPESKTPEPVHATEESFRHMLSSVDEHFNQVAKDVQKSLDETRLPDSEGISAKLDDAQKEQVELKSSIRVPEIVETSPEQLAQPEKSAHNHPEHAQSVPSKSFNDAFLELDEPVVAEGIPMTDSAREEQLRRILQQKQQQAAQALQGLQQHPSIAQHHQVPEIVLQQQQQQQRQLIEQLQRQGVPPHLIAQYQEAMAAQQRSQLAQRQQAAGMSPLDIQEQMIAEQQRLQALAADVQARRLHPDAQNREKRLSSDDEKALLVWELERQQLEADRLRKLQDREVGGDDASDLTGTSSRVLEQLLPGSHISYHSTSPEEDPEMLKPFDTPQARRPEPKLEQKLLSEIDQLAGAAHDLTLKRERYGNL